MRKYSSRGGECTLLLSDVTFWEDDVWWWRWEGAGGGEAGKWSSSATVTANSDRKIRPQETKNGTVPKCCLFSQLSVVEEKDVNSRSCCTTHLSKSCEQKSSYWLHLCLLFLPVLSFYCHCYWHERYVPVWSQRFFFWVFYSLFGGGSESDGEFQPKLSDEKRSS